jgi:hypothetical protein
MNDKDGAVREFRQPKDADAYRACLAAGVGYIANCCSGWQRGYKLHHASCPWLHMSHTRIRPAAAQARVWAATTPELEEYADSNRRPDRCGGCFKTETPDQHDTNIPRESHIAVPGGQVESNRSRH